MYTKIIDAITEYYIQAIIDSQQSGAMPPALNITKAVFDDNAVVNVYTSEVYHGNRVATINLFCSLRRIPDVKFYGKMPYKIFKTIEEELDIAVGEYRRTTFKRISKQQRHREDPNASTCV